MIAARLRDRGKKGQPRPRVVPLWRSRRALTVWAAVLVVAVAGSGWLAWNAGMPQRDLAPDATMAGGRIVRKRNAA